MIATIIFVISIFVFLWFGSINIVSLIYQQDIYSGNLAVMCIALTFIIIHCIGIL